MVGRQTLNYSKVSAALVNYEVRRQDKLSSSESTSAEALAIRGRSSNRKGESDHERSKFRSSFKDLKKNQCAFYKVLGNWKIDCPKAKGKKKELKTEANLAQVVSTQASKYFTGRWIRLRLIGILSPLLLLLLITQETLSRY